MRLQEHNIGSAEKLHLFITIFTAILYVFTLCNQKARGMGRAQLRVRRMNRMKSTR
jgi:hypothetical protein